MNEYELNNIDVIHENMEKFSQLLLFNRINCLIQNSLDLDKRLHAIMTFITAGQGLGFNRAFLFFVNAGHQILEGVCGVAPENKQDAHRIWAQLDEQYNSIEELIMASPNTPSMPPSIENIVKSIRLPIVREMGVLALTVIERRPFNVTDAEHDPKVNQKCRQILKTTAFATVPLYAGDTIIGVIFVDNAFNYRPIRDSDMELLMNFANQAGLMIEHARMYEQLKEQLTHIRNMWEQLLQAERIATWNKLSLALAHEIRTPLVPIGGFARRLYKNLSNGDEAKKQAAIIVNEVKRLEEALNNLLNSDPFSSLEN